MEDRNVCKTCEDYYYCSNAHNETLCDSYSPILNNSKGMFRKLYTWKGRIRRKEYCLFYVIFFIAAVILGEQMRSSDSYNTIIVLICSILILLLRIILLLQDIKRSHDLGNSGWWILLPIYNPFFLMFAKGDDGVNEYGSNPKENYDFQIYEKESID